ncbi:hypothetical protein [Shimia haliotis]|uniref:Uncharacterized protein n=1 Tax=Shimia haliotis TaxID=1280847 RepID=A0A1I4F9E5_9RHOB|nr:hypothetical protein [Shimia haliotis]SFL14524.1 hypothetical protein SAMN04488036_105301 [Shimia haliotis]
MPDPVSNAEIEDVLTSIRRLVSENRPVDSAPVVDDEATDDETAHQGQPSEVPAKSVPMALVLTPALRVEDAQDRAFDEFDAEAGDEDSSEILDVAEFESDHAESLEIPEEEETLEADRFDDVEEVAETTEAFADPEIEGPELVAEDDDGTDDVEPALEDGQDDAEHTSDMDAYGLQETADELNGELATDDLEDVSKPEGEDGDALGNSGFVEATDESFDESDVEEPFDFKKVLEARLVNWRDGEEAVTVEGEPVDSDYAEAELTVSAEPITPSAEPLDAMAYAAETQIETEAVEGIAEEVEQGLADALDDPAVIDEEALREMVADIVRQELQGALGERITRNVRKLVRREIHRALAAHDLD